jgi:hypothetical protein
MMTYTQNGPHCGRKETKQCSSSQISVIPCAPIWASRILSQIWCSSITMVCIDTYSDKMEFLDIPSLGTTYRYVIKIEQKLKQKMWKFGLGNPSQQKPRKGGPNPLKKGQSKDEQPQDN